MREFLTYLIGKIKKKKKTHEKSVGKCVIWVGSVHWYNTLGGSIKFEDMFGSYEDRSTERKL